MTTAKKFPSLAGFLTYSSVGLAACLAFHALHFEARAAVPTELIVLGDTQYYTNHPAPNTLGVQNNWIVKNLASENISFVTQVGDLTDEGSNLAYMQSADTEMKILDGPGPNGIVPYSVTLGNHDTYPTGDTTNFHTYFGASRYSNYSWFGGSSSDQLSNYQIFNMNGISYLHLNVRWAPEPATLSWAQSVLSAHPNLPTIVSTHEYMNVDVPGRDAEGDFLWNNLISPNSQVFMVLCGHYWPEQHQVSTNLAGKKVIEIQADFQNLSNGGNGWLQKVVFDPDAGQIRVKTYSPLLNEFKTASNDEFAFSVNFGSQINVNGEISPIRTWGGAGADANWSTAANWSLAPVNGDMLTFSGTARQSSVNDLSLPSVSLVTFNNGGFNVNGNSLTLNAGIVSSGDNTWGIYSTLGANQTFTSKSGTLTLSGGIDTNGDRLTMNCMGNITVANSLYGTGSLIKTGSGNLSLLGTSSYSGTISVNAGKLIVNGYLASPVTVAAGATLSASGTINNAVSIRDAGKLEINGLGNGTLMVQNLTFSYLTTLNLSSTILASSSPLNVMNSNGLTAQGMANSVTINLTGGLLRVGTYSVIDYAGAIQGAGFGAFKLGTLPSGMTATLLNDSANTAIDLIVTHGVSSTSTWTGSGSNMYLSNPANWNAAPLNGDTLTFAGTAQQTIFNDSPLTDVSAINFNNGGFFVVGNPLTLYNGLNNAGDNTWGIDTKLIVDQNFQITSGTLTANGALSGTSRLTKTGNGNLKLASANSYAGGTTINAGAVVLSHPNALGLGDVAIASGQLKFDFGSGTASTIVNNIKLPVIGMPEFTINSASSPTIVRLAGKISGGAAGQTYVLADSGVTANYNNILVLNNPANDFQGNMQLSRGWLGITSNGALGNANNTIISNVGGGNGGLVFYADNVTIASGHSIQLMGAEVINAQDYSSAIAAPITGPGGFTKTGSGSLALFGANSYSGATVIGEGRLIVNGSLAASTVSVAGGATLAGSGTINGSVTLGETASLEAGGGIDTAPLTLSRLSFTGTAAMNLSPNTTSPTSNALDVTMLNGLTVGGPANSVMINIRGIADVGSYHLIDYNGAIQGRGFNAFQLGSLPPGMTAVLINNAADTSIDLNVTHDAISTSAWTGGGIDNHWSTGANWEVPPSNGSSITFPTAAGPTFINNDAINSLRTVTFNGGGFTVNGNPITLHGGIIDTGDNTWAVDSTLGENQTIQVNSGTLTMSGTISGNHDLAKSGLGKLIVENCNISGNLTVASGTLEAQSLIVSSQVTVNGTLIAGSIVADTLTIGNPVYAQNLSLQGDSIANATHNVPEPTSLSLLAGIISGWAGWFFFPFRKKCR